MLRSDNTPYPHAGSKAFVTDQDDAGEIATIVQACQNGQTLVSGPNGRRLVEADHISDPADHPVRATTFTRPAPRPTLGLIY